MEFKSDLSFKICLFGAGGVGKTTLANHYLTGVFDDTIKMTMGAVIHVKTLEIEGHNIYLQIWDFGGEDLYSVLLPTYSIGAFGGIFMYDITRLISLYKCEDWITAFRNGLDEGSKDVPTLMVGGKTDLKHQRIVSQEEAQKYAKQFNLNGVMECSSKTGDNVEKVFETLVRAILKHKEFI